jgi:hypothetical protein
LQPGIREARPEHLFFFVVLLVMLVDNASSEIVWALISLDLFTASFSFRGSWNISRLWWSWNKSRSVLKIAWSLKIHRSRTTDGTI